MNILLLGGTGVLSSDILIECLSHNNEVYVVNRGNYPNPNFNNPHCHIIKGDVRNPSTYICQLSDLSFDVVVDFLSTLPCHLQTSWDALEKKVKQYIFISSCCVFRRSKEDGIIYESSPKPNSLLDYSINKLACENLLLDLAKNSNVYYTIVRPYITYGSTRIPFGIAPYGRKDGTIIARIRFGKPMFIWDKGEANCSILNTVDFAKIFYKLICNPKAFNEDVNLTNSSSQSWKDVLITIYKCLNIKPYYISIDRNNLAKSLPSYSGFILGDRALNAVFNLNKLYAIVPESKEILQHAINLQDGISKTVSCYDENNNMSGIDYFYDAIIDRAIAKNTKDPNILRSLKYIDYMNKNSLRDWILYHTYRYLPFYYASISFKIINKISNIMRRAVSPP